MKLLRSSTQLIAIALGAVASAQTTWYVDCNATPPGSGTVAHPYTNIQYAISRSTTVSGDELQVYPGVYSGPIDFIGKELYVWTTNGSAETTIDGAQQGSVVTFRNGEGSNARLQGFTLRNGSGRFIAMDGVSLGGGVYCVNSSPTILNCTITDNATLAPTLTVAGRGGGVYCGPGASLTLSNCTVSNNDARVGGGIALERGSLDMQGGAVLFNRALGNPFFEPARGGGIFAFDHSHFALHGVDVSSNVAVGDETGHTETLGGGVRIELTASALVEGCTVSKNDSGGFSFGYGDLMGWGGGISSAAVPADVVIDSTNVHDNWGNNGGGGVHGTGVLDQCVIEKNHGQFGGGVGAQDMTLTNCIIRNNHGSVSGSYDWGGGVFADVGAHALVQHCEIASNTAYGQGGGGWGGTYVDCDIHDNYASADIDAGFIAGGGVYDGELIGCRVWNNHAEEWNFFTAWGGGVYDGSAERCLIYDNVADSGGGAGYADLVNCTIASNQSTSGPGGGIEGGSVRNTIVRFNLPDDVGLSTSASWSNVPIGVPGVGNLSADPLFWNVAAHDFQLRLGSPCIDTGDPASPPDPDGSRVDMGAIPFDANHCGAPITYCTPKTNSLGCTPSIATNGASSSIAGGQFRVEAHNVRNLKNGLLFWGTQKLGVPFQGGFLCVAPPMVRTSVQDSGGSASGDDCTGTYSFQWTSSYIAARALSAGDTLYCQYWSRDPDDPNTVGLTDALQFTLCP